MTHSINIKNLSLIVNLRNTSASSYLDFIEETKKIKLHDTGKIISSSKYKNDYLVIYVENKPTEVFLTKLLIDALLKHELDFVAIDELFPDDNSRLLNRNDIRVSKDWIIDSTYDKNKSSIIVK